ARHHNQRALAVAEQLQDTLRQARVHFNLATIAARGEESEAATLHFEQAMALYQAIGDQVRVELTRTNMGAFFVSTRRYHLAIAAARQALGFFERIQFADWVALNAINLSESYIALEDYGLAEQYASQVVALELTAHMPNVLTILGTIRLRQQAFGEAQTLLEEAIEIAQANTDPYIAAFAWRSMGEVHAAVHDQPKARAAFEQSLELFSALRLAPEVERTRALLEALGNSDSR
nr:tetratricopeptide repeat protein [Herpetosiphonaceae bacterium]